MRTSSHVRLKNTTEKIRSADRRSHKTNDRESRPPIAMKTEYEFTEVLRFSPRIRFSEPRRSAWSTICPFLMNKIVGMLRTAYCTAIALFESTSHLPIVTLPSYSPASSSMIGATIRQGPHHSAQKSITSGLPESSNPCRFSDVIVSAIISVFLKFMFHCGRTKVIITSDKSTRRRQK